MEPADALPSPYKADFSTVRAAQVSVEKQVKTGAYDALNVASGARLDRRDGGNSTAGKERLIEIRDQLNRALTHVEESIAGPSAVWEDRGGETIYAKPWETSLIGASGDVQYSQRMERPSARSYNGNSRDEQARRDQAFGKGRGKG